MWLLRVRIRLPAACAGVYDCWTGVLVFFSSVHSVYLTPGYLCVLLCSIKPGKIVIVLNGRFAGRKAVVIRTSDEGSKDRKFGHALIAGVDRYPRKTTKAMGNKKVAKRQRVKPFVKYVNFNHIMPTRYNLDLTDKLKAAVTDEALVHSEDRSAKAGVLKTVKEAFEGRYKSLGDGKADKLTTGALYFFRKLHF
jgi:large subunit ribosomal protein L27e